MARDRVKLSLLKQVLEQTHLLAYKIHPGSVLGGPALVYAKMLCELSDIAMKLREERKKKADQMKKL